LWFANHLDSQKSDENRTKLAHKPRKHADSLDETSLMWLKHNVLGVDWRTYWRTKLEWWFANELELGGIRCRWATFLAIETQKRLQKATI
jgi:hypothetical protein